jgi:hypothetical protein
MFVDYDPIRYISCDNTFKSRNRLIDNFNQ